MAGLETLRREVMGLIDRNKQGNAARVLGKGLRDITPEYFGKFAQILTDVIDRDYERFMKEGFFVFYFFATKNQHNLDLFENFYVENYCLYQPMEEILTFVPGIFGDKISLIQGNTYITNLRVIATGSSRVQMSKTMRARMAVGSQTTTHQGIIDRYGNNIATPARFGYVYPVFGNYSLQRKRDSVNFSVDIQYGKPGREKTKKVDLSIKPKSGNIEKRLELIEKILNEHR